MANYPSMLDQYHNGYAELAKEIPKTTASFGRLVMDATTDGALSTKVKELMALSIAITMRCDGCMAHHAQAVAQAGATRQDVAEAIGVAIAMGGGPSTIYGVAALRAYDRFTESKTQMAYSGIPPTDPH